MRLGLKILGGAIVAGLLLLAILLIPAHQQVRSVEPPLPTVDALRELLAVPGGPTSIRYVETSSQKMPEGRLGHMVFLAEWPSQDLFMIDTGMDRKTALEFGELMVTVLGADEAVSHGTIAELLGSGTRRVKGVAFTHLHIDHSQGTQPFCEARGAGASVFQTRFQAELHNFNTEEGAAIVADSCLTPRRVGEGALETLADFPGLGMVALGGHTPGSTLFAAAVNGHLWIFSGDITNSKRDLTNNTGKGFLYSYLMVPEHTRRNEALRIWLADLDAQPDMTVVVSHDLPDIVASGMPEYVR